MFETQDANGLYQDANGLYRDANGLYRDANGLYQDQTSKSHFVVSTLEQWQNMYT